MTQTNHPGAVLPAGARVWPEAARALQNALDALQRGLVVWAWNWCAIAHRILDEATEGPEATEGGKG